MDRWVAARHNSATVEENGTEEPSALGHLDRKSA